MPAVYLFAGIIVVFMMGTGLSYLWLGNQVDAVSRDIKLLERQQDETARHIQNEEYKWSNLRTLSAVQVQLSRFGIEMAWPSRDRVVHLSCPLQNPSLPESTVMPPAQWALVRAHE